MTKTSTFEVQFRRRREQKTNYKKRLHMLSARKPRLVVRKTNRTVIAQVVEYSAFGDKTICSAVSRELKKLGVKTGSMNITSAYLTGYLCAKRAQKKKINETILDIGIYSPVHGSRVFACLKGAIDAGLKIPAGEEVFPKENRIKGEHLSKKITNSEFENALKNIENAVK